MADVSMPRLSDSMEEGTILKWLKSDGDEVKRGDELVEIETDKANMTYEADQDGVLSITASEGDTLAVGEKIASDRRGGRAGRRRRAAASEQPEAQEQQDEPRARAAEPQDEEPEAEQEPRAEEPSREAEQSRSPSPRRSRRPRPEPEAEEEPEAEPERGPRARRTGAPRPAPSRGGWRASWASSSRRSRAPGPAGGS